MAVGGYRIIDIKGKDIGSSSVSIPGIYEAIESSINKPVLLVNYKFNAIEQHPAYVNFRASGNSYIGIFNVIGDGTGINKIRVTSSDIVTVSALIRATASPAMADEPSASM